MTPTERAQLAAALVTRTCAAQNIPEQVTDPDVIRQVAAILATGAS
jgi:hypothetical protein